MIDYLPFHDDYSAFACNLFDERSRNIEQMNSFYHSLDMFLRLYDRLCHYVGRLVFGTVSLLLWKLAKIDEPY